MTTTEPVLVGATTTIPVVGSEVEPDALDTSDITIHARIPIEIAQGALGHGKGAELLSKYAYIHVRFIPSTERVDVQPMGLTTATMSVGTASATVSAGYRMSYQLRSVTDEASKIVVDGVVEISHAGSSSQTYVQVLAPPWEQLRSIEAATGGGEATVHWSMPE